MDGVRRAQAADEEYDKEDAMREVQELTKRVAGAMKELQEDTDTAGKAEAGGAEHSLNRLVRSSTGDGIVSQ